MTNLLAKTKLDNISFKEVTEKDKPHYIQTHHVAYRETIEKMFEWDDKYQDKAAENDFENKDNKLCKIIKSDCVVGYVGFNDKKDSIYFGPFYILPEHQNKGFGSKILKYCINIAIEKRKKIVLRTLLENKKAKSLYEKNGFLVSDTSDIHWNMVFMPEESNL